MIDLQDWHFLRPLWLLGMPFVLLLLWLIWRRNIAAATPWRKVCDEWLLQQLVLDGNHSRRAIPLTLFLFGTGLLLLAAAGPSWDKLTQAAHRQVSSRVLVFDLSLSMRAEDIQPSRLERARSAAAQLLQYETQYQTGLVVYAGDAFVAAPLTFDDNTLLAMLAIFDPSLMPLQGSRPDLGMEEAVKLMRGAGATRGEIILICDGFKGERTIKLAKTLHEKGYTTHVVAIGSEFGAPIPLRSGKELVDLAGNVVHARTDLQALAALAQAGGGRFISLNLAHSNLAPLATEPPSESVQTLNVESREAETWRDQGPWFVLPLLPLAALSFRRGWLLSLMLGCMLSPSSPDALAWDWADFWQRPDQRAARSLAKGETAPALEQAKDPAWRGSALYRSGRYLAAAQAFAELDDVESHYNRGNALAKGGELQAALDAYEIVLQRAPEHADATYNRFLVMALLRDQQTRRRTAGPDRLEDVEGIALQLQDSDSIDSSPNSAFLRQQIDADNTSNSAGADGPRPEDKFDLSDVERSPDGSGQDQRADADSFSDDAEHSRAPQEGNLDDEELDRWLSQVPDDPGEILRRKFEQSYRSRQRYRTEAFGDAW